jgi:hypothetical protein
MYAIDRRVYVKSLDQIGVISERGYHSGSPRRAFYIVAGFKDNPGFDFMTGSNDLRAADCQCDGCDKWLPEGSFNGVPQPRDYEGYLVARFCFLCYLKSKKEYG